MSKRQHQTQARAKQKNKLDNNRESAKFLKLLSKDSDADEALEHLKQAVIQNEIIPLAGVAKLFGIFVKYGNFYQVDELIASVADHHLAEVSLDLWEQVWQSWMIPRLSAPISHVAQVLHAAMRGSTADQANTDRLFRYFELMCTNKKTPSADICLALIQYFISNSLMLGAIKLLERMWQYNVPIKIDTFSIFFKVWIIRLHIEAFLTSNKLQGGL